MGSTSDEHFMSVFFAGIYIEILQGFDVVRYDMSLKNSGGVARVSEDFCLVRGFGREGGDRIGYGCFGTHGKKIDFLREMGIRGKNFLAFGYLLVL